MEFSEIYSFFININLQSIKLILKNGKSMASLAIITHSLMSILLFLLIISNKSLTHNISDSFMEPYTPTSSPAINPASSSSQDTFLLHIFTYMALLFLVQFAFMLTFVAISYVSSVAAILISAASYTDKYISFHYLFSLISEKGKMLWTARTRWSRNQPGQYLVLLVFPLGLWVMYPTPLTFSIIFLFGVMAALFVMYSMVSWNLAMVISVMEEGLYGKEALEKGEELVKGHSVHGFVLNVFYTLVGLILLLVYWFVSGDKVYLAFPYLGLVMVTVNIFSLVKMLATVEYTVLYFECKKYHGQEIEVFGDLKYTNVAYDDGAQV